MLGERVEYSVWERSTAEDRSEVPLVCVVVGHVVGSRACLGAPLGGMARRYVIRQL